MQVSKKILVSGNFTYGKNKEKDAKNLIEHNSDKKYDNYLSTFHKWLVKRPQNISLASKIKKKLEKYELIWNKTTSITGKFLIKH